MQLRVFPDNILEWLALRLKLVPLPLLHAQIFPVVSKAVLEAVDAGIFEAIEAGHGSAESIATACQLHPRATEQLLGVLTSMRYLRFRRQTYRLTRSTRKWILAQSPDTVRDLAIYNNRVVWPWLDQMGHYLRTGQGIQYHDSFGPDEWDLYQKAMNGGAISEAREFARNLPLSANATRMLDIGGSHGQHSVEACRRFPSLQSVILDLPGAIEKAAPLLARQGMGKRVVHQPGNILSDQLPDATYDLVLMSSLAHHFTTEQNQEVIHKISQCLRPGGIVVINEFIRPNPQDAPELVGSSTDLFFGLTSTSGNWSVDEIHGWYRAANLLPYKILSYRAIPGRFQVVGRKPF
ncbi:class I SAM-dependent methyltransferase [Arundinibacter roseus]|uniref:Class I SAM-dependent methyltransferase n=1 Tax=Arundinibacter roseus TaxID=2070510 RepID=A0A4R4KKQ7_9BACT|nr:class I SAM-dependent methyltransferase [Arundinibacter roseus]TDB68850.1 class I SAM-dependent methyltransferase [Arundinibacter roseus]